MKRIVGIDPGLAGAVALLEDGNLIGIWEMPTEAKREKGNRVDCYGLHEIAGALGSADLVAIEAVSAMPKQGVATQFQFGDSFGAVRLFAALVSKRTEYVTPARWKKALQVGANKGHSITRAHSLYPDSRKLITLKKQDGLAEALLIAHYARLYL